MACSWVLCCTEAKHGFNNPCCAFCNPHLLCRVLTEKKTIAFLLLLCSLCNLQSGTLLSGRMLAEGSKGGNAIPDFHSEKKIRGRRLQTTCQVMQGN